MKILIALILSATGTAVCLAKAPDAKAPELIQFKCHGNYANHVDAPRKDARLNDIYIEISGTQVRVSGARNLNARYVLVSDRADGIEIARAPEKHFSGFIDRLNGKMWLKETAPDDSRQIRQSLIGNCTRSHALF